MKLKSILKMNPVEKRLLLGGIMNGLVYWTERYAEGHVAGFPIELTQRLDPHLPTNGAIVSSITPTGVLYLARTASKSGSTKEKVGDMALGAALHGLPNLMRETISRTAYTEGVNARPATRAVASIPASRYAIQAQNRVTEQVGTYKYRVTS